jgi:transcriptional regulator with XRE-family HTH domain
MKTNIAKIKKEMVRRKWNQSDLARELKTSRQLVSQMMKADFSKSLIRRCAEIFEADERDFIL